MENIKAFPNNHGEHQGRNPKNEGMDLRDYFAAKYMQANSDNEDLTFEHIAKEAYNAADAMIRQRVK